MPLPAAEPSDARSPSPACQPEAEFLNRELSWLEFNRRVLFQALDRRTPLLERLRFLSIFGSNLDEFFMKRVGGLKRQLAAGVRSHRPHSLTPEQQLAAIREIVLPLLAAQAEAYTADIRPALAQAGVHLRRWSELTPAEHAAAEAYFKANVYPVLTPLAVDPGHPFPFISNLSTSLGVLLRHPTRKGELFARVKVPSVLPAWIPLPDAAGEHCFVSLLELISHNLDDLFPGMLVLDVMPFRITRNADIERDEEDAEDLLELIEDELRRRRMEKIVRLEHGPDPNGRLLLFLREELELEEADVYEMPALLDYSGLWAVADLDLPQHRYEPWHPLTPPELAGDEPDIFTVIRQGDLLLHHPYDSFSTSVQLFIAQAVEDPRVLAIKMTVYRTGEDSPFIPMLVRAAEAGKQVICLLELKARFDEARNITIAQQLEKAGVHVVYGVVGLKTHCKTALVVRRDADGLRSYAHIGTGNYHTQTARLYTDLGLLTCRPEYTADVIELFNYLTGRSLRREYRHLLVAPVNLKQRLLEMIAREATHARAGRPARITAKMNSLEDRDICRALYDASAAGVPIDLIVRGFCCLRPGVPGMSENIRVISVIGRFLEHSRIFSFQAGADDPLDGEMYIGSADWMYRNLLARVEAVAPILDRRLRQRCLEILQVMLADPCQAWEMQPEGSYRRREDDAPEALSRGTHQALMELTRRRAGAGARMSAAGATTAGAGAS